MTTSSVAELVSREGAGYRDLYYRWEHEQWEAGKIDLGPDAASWPALDAFARRHLADAIDWRRVRSELATTALVAFVDAAPTEEQQVFLTTQLADEARAGVFLDRVAMEVLGETESDMEARSSTAGGTLAPGLRGLLEDSLTGAAARLRGISGDQAIELVRAVAGYHLAVLGVLGLNELHALLKGDVAGLDGISEGLAMMERDATRHVAFALLFSAETAVGAAGAAALERGLNDSVPAALAALRAAAESAPGFGDGADLQERARNDLAAWLRAVKLRVPTLA